MSDGGVSNQVGLWGGKISSTQVKLNITQDMNGVKIACQGTNEALQRSINEAIELQVLCKYTYNDNFLCVKNKPKDKKLFIDKLTYLLTYCFDNRST